MKRVQSWAAVVVVILLLPLLLSSNAKSARTDYYEDQVAVLMYHHIHPTQKGSAIIPPKLFAEQIDYLQKKGFNFITLKEFRDFLAGASVPPKAVLVTFDDGYESFYQYAYPELKKRSVPAVNFVITAYTDHNRNSVLGHLTSKQIREMTSETNFIDMQCHTNMLHYKQTGARTSALSGPIEIKGKKETAEQYKKRIAADIKACTESLKASSDKTIDALAYPYGLRSKTAIETLKEAGYTMAFTTEGGMATRGVDTMQIPRINGGNPTISPNQLWQQIVKSVSTVKPLFDSVVLKDAVDQLGGSVALEPGGNVSLQYGKSKIIIHPGSSDAVVDGKTVKLKHKPTIKQHRTHIHLNDLEMLLNTEIVYWPKKNLFQLRAEHMLTEPNPGTETTESQGKTSDDITG